MTALVLIGPSDPTGAIALETALRLELGAVVVVSVGDESRDAPLRATLAAGAEKAIRISAPIEHPIEEAFPIAALAGDLAPTLVLAGARRGRIGTNPVGPALAEMLALPHVGSVARIDRPDEETVRVLRRREGMLDMISCPLPAVVSVEWGPRLRYPTLRGRLRARRADIEVVDGASEPLGKVKIIRRTGPKPRRKLAQRTGPALDHVIGMMLGGAAGEGSGQRLEGAPAAVAAQIVAACIPILRSL